MAHYGLTVKYQQSGFSLLEVLIAAIVVSISLLGLIVLQGISKYSTVEARQRTMAMYIATDLQDRLRLNKTAWLNQPLAANNATYSTSVSGASRTIPDCAQTNGLMANCSQSDLINLDLYSFQEQLRGASVTGSDNSLLSPVGCLQLSRVNSQDAASVIITVSWQDRGKLNGSLQNSLNTSCGNGGQTHRQYVVRTVL
jgi:type IV pilus modification protein PilV